MSTVLLLALVLTDEADGLWLPINYLLIVAY